MRSMPHIVSLMTAFPYSIEVDCSLSEARTMMKTANVRHLPVMRGGTLIGVISDRDISLTFGVCRDETIAAELRVEDAYTDEFYAVESDTRLDKVVIEMVERKIGSALVTRHGKLVGIFTTTDVCRFLAEILPVHFPDA